jgi:hypothetical protein
MLKREIKYEDFDGNEIEEIFYFNISKPELIEMEIEHEGGLGKFLQNIIETKDHRELIKKFKDIVLLAYGQKSEDGKRFIKSDKLREEFSQSAAYSTLFMELATDDGKAAIFLKGVLPKDLAGAFDEAQLAVPPTTPSS